MTISIDKHDTSNFFLISKELIKKGDISGVSQPLYKISQNQPSQHLTSKESTNSISSKPTLNKK